MKSLLLVSAMLTLLAACSQQTPDLKSPCVGAEGSPCERRAPAEQSLT
jgi:putative hemolysin